MTAMMTNCLFNIANDEIFGFGSTAGEDNLA